MTWQFAGDAEVAAGTNKTRAKHFLPEAIDRHAARERVILQQQPLRESQTVSRRGLWKRRQDLGGVGLHLVLAPVVFAAVQDKRLGHLVFLVHDMGHGAALADRGLLFLELRDLRRRGLEWLVEAAEPPVVEFLPGLRAFIRREFHHVGNQLGTGEALHLCRREGAAPDREARQADCVRGRTLGTAADHERNLRADRAFLKLVVFDLRLFLQLAVVVDLHTLGLARAVVGDRNERPFVGLELILRDDLQPILRKGMDKVHRDAPALNPDIPAPIGIRLVHPRDHGI